MRGTALLSSSLGGAYSRTRPEVPSTEPASCAAPELTIVVPTFNEAASVGELVLRLQDTLKAYDWEVIFVDDNSPDGTAEIIRAIGAADRRVRCIRRIGRRGLAGACIEGMLASQARYIVVMDADLQHDERVVPQMVERLRNELDLVVASRFLDTGVAPALTKARLGLSRLSIRLSRALLKVSLTDPMSGYFAIRRETFEKFAPQLSTEGFKILLDIATCASMTLKIEEVPGAFRARHAGESKLDSRVTFDFVTLLISKLTRNYISYRFILFCLVGSTGLVVHMTALDAGIKFAQLPFVTAQTTATILAIASNFVLNNYLTYSDQRLSGWKFWSGLLTFQIICGVGALSNVGVASTIYNSDSKWWVAGLAGAVVGTAWNYILSATCVWRV